MRREKLYSPEIRPEKVRELYRLKLKTGMKMTELVDEALGQYLARERKGGEKKNQ